MKIKHLLFVVIFALNSIAPAKDSIRIDADGRKGADGNNGRSHSGTAYQGNEGDNGGHGTPGEPGTSAQNITAQISATPQQGVLVLRAQIGNSPAGEQTVVIQDVRGIVASAAGANGGAGGTGGDGEKGGQGYSGSDATEYSNASDGGQGYRGGNAGDGADGGDGGNGGTIRIQLNQELLHVLLLVRTNVSRGQGGPAGRNGRPGNGGDGGSGGSGYFSSKQVESGTTTNADGSTTTQYRTETISRSSGSTGATGPSGDRSQATPQRGNDGKDGQVYYEVTEADGRVNTYEKPFNLKIDHYDVVSENDDGILEPGEKVYVKGLTVRNTGGMPTPSVARIKILLHDSTYFVAEPLELTIPHSLRPGETFRFDTDTLAFKVKNNLLKTAGAARASWDDVVKPLAGFKEIPQTSFADSNSSTNIVITYPVQIDNLDVERSLVPGGSTKVLIRIKNISKNHLGLSAEIKRALSVLYQSAGGDLDLQNLTVRTKDGRVLDMAGSQVDIPLLRAGESVIIEGTLQVAANAEPYTGHEIEIGLGLQVDVAENAKGFQKIQAPRFTVRVSNTYVQSPDAGILVITNSSTDREAIRNLKTMESELGIKMNFWDLSLYGHASLTRALESGSSLLNDFQGKSIIVLGNDTFVGDDRHAPTELLHSNELLQALSAKGIHVTILGGDKDVDRLKGTLIPKAAEEKLPYGSMKEFQKALRNYDPAQIAAAEAAQTQNFEEIQITRHSIWGKPTAKDLQKEVSCLQKWYDKYAPDRRYVIVTDFSPEFIKKGFLQNKWQVGKIQIRHSADYYQGSLIQVALSDPNFSKALGSDEALFGVITGLGFRQKLALLNRLIADTKYAGGKERRMMLAQMLTTAMMLELVEEQGLMRRAAWRWGQSSAELAKRLIKLNLLEKELQAEGVEHFEVQPIIQDFIVEMTHMMKKSYTWWERLIPFRKNPLVARLSLNVLNKIENNIFQKLSGQYKGPWRRDMAEKTKAVEKRDEKLTLGNRAQLLDKTNTGIVMTIEEARRLDLKVDAQNNAADQIEANALANRAELTGSGGKQCSDAL